MEPEDDEDCDCGEKSAEQQNSGPKQGAAGKHASESSIPPATKPTETPSNAKSAPPATSPQDLKDPNSAKVFFPIFSSQGLKRKYSCLMNGSGNRSENRTGVVRVSSDGSTSNRSQEAPGGGTRPRGGSSRSSPKSNSSSSAAEVQFIVQGSRNIIKVSIQSSKEKAYLSSKFQFSMRSSSGTIAILQAQFSSDKDKDKDKGNDNDKDKNSSSSSNSNTGPESRGPSGSVPPPNPPNSSEAMLPFPLPEPLPEPLPTSAPYYKELGSFYNDPIASWTSTLRQTSDSTTTPLYNEPYMMSSQDSLRVMAERGLYEDPKMTNELSFFFGGATPFIPYSGAQKSRAQDPFQFNAIPMMPQVRPALLQSMTRDPRFNTPMPPAHSTPRIGSPSAIIVDPAAAFVTQPKQPSSTEETTVAAPSDLHSLEEVVDAGPQPQTQDPSVAAGPSPALEDKSLTEPSPSEIETEDASSSVTEGSQTAPSSGAGATVPPPAGPGSAAPSDSNNEKSSSAAVPAAAAPSDSNNEKSSSAAVPAADAPTEIGFANHVNRSDLSPLLKEKIKEIPDQHLVIYPSPEAELYVTHLAANTNKPEVKQAARPKKSALARHPMAYHPMAYPPNLYRNPSSFGPVYGDAASARIPISMDIFPTPPPEPLSPLLAPDSPTASASSETTSSQQQESANASALNAETAPMNTSENSSSSNSAVFTFTVSDPTVTFYCNNRLIPDGKSITLRSGDYLFMEHGPNTWAATFINFNILASETRQRCERSTPPESSRYVSLLDTYPYDRVMKKRSVLSRSSAKSSSTRILHLFDYLSRVEPAKLHMLLESFDDVIEENLIYPDENTSSWDSFEYPISIELKQYLLQLVRTYLFDPEKVRALQSLNTLSRFTLFKLGDSMEILIEKLLKTIAKEVHARIYNTSTNSAAYSLTFVMVSPQRHISRYFCNIRDKSPVLTSPRQPVTRHFQKTLPPPNTVGFVCGLPRNLNGLVGVKIESPSDPLYNNRFYFVPAYFVKLLPSKLQSFYDILGMISFLNVTTGVFLKPSLSMFLPSLSTLSSQSPELHILPSSMAPSPRSLETQSTRKMGLITQSSIPPTIILLKNIDAINPRERSSIFKSFLESLPDNSPFMFFASEKQGDSSMTQHGEKCSHHFLNVYDEMQADDFREPAIHFLSNRPIFKYEITINPPTGGPELIEWDRLLDRDSELIHKDLNLRLLRRIYPDLPPEVRIECLKEKFYSVNQLKHLLSLAVVQQPVTSEELVPCDLEGAHNMMLSLLSEEESHIERISKIHCENEFEKNLLTCVIMPQDIGVRFSDIGSLEGAKKLLFENVTLPLVRSELFRVGQLRNPCRGILLFGPPGTGKTMLAKGVATEAGACFLNISASVINSKWFGEAEKNAKHIFTLARKLAPCVVFIDEVDALLGDRGSRTEHEASRKVKNEFMSGWDGLRNKNTERVIVLGCTNRPYDLDDAVLRRFPRRVFVDTPTREERVAIFRKVLCDDQLGSDIDFDHLGNEDVSGGFSGSDIKTLCEAAAYVALNDFLDEEKEMEKNGMSTHEIQSLGRTIRPLIMSDFYTARKKITASTNSGSKSLEDLRRWNERYGDGARYSGGDLSYYV